MTKTKAFQHFKFHGCQCWRSRDFIIPVSFTALPWFQLGWRSFRCRLRPWNRSFPERWPCLSSGSWQHRASRWVGIPSSSCEASWWGPWAFASVHVRTFVECGKGGAPSAAHCSCPRAGRGPLRGRWTCGRYASSWALLQPEMKS